MKNRMALGKQLMASFAAMLAVATLLCLFSIINFSSFQRILNTQVATSAQKADVIGQVTTSLAEMRGERQLLIADTALETASGSKKKAPPRSMGGEERRDTLRASSARMDRLLATLGPLLTEPKEKEIFRVFQTDHEAWATHHRDLGVRCANCHTPGVAGLKNNQGQQGRLNSAAADLAQLQRDSLTAASGRVASQIYQSRWILVANEVLCVLVALGLFRVIRRSTKSLRKTAGLLSQGSTEAAVAASQVKNVSAPLAQSASEQARTAQTTSATAEQLASMTQKNAENSRQSAALMLRVEEAIQAANVTLHSLQSSMDEISGSSEKISGIIKVIDGIAFQTNLLALNAAVEAARAGEAGLGFAVVAQEVRKLAQNSADAAKDTSVLIEESVARAVEGRTRLEEVIRSIQGVTQRSAEVKALVDGVNTASQEQAKGIEEIAGSVRQMEQHVEQLSRHVEGLVAAGERMGTVTENMQNGVVRLYTLVDGNAAAAVTAAAA